ncbi:MAG TPA: inorganic diphosphatase [Bacilli bacterium]|nr:inorganic diphosphatase [Bacilli bacterium]
METIVDAIIEIPMGTRNKYEINKETGRIRLSRVQYSSMTYPAEYGFIENTLSNDNDPLDILVVTTEPTFPGCIVEARVVGYLQTIDGGFGDNKIIAVNNVDPRFKNVKDLDDIGEHVLLEIKNFFQNYKTLQNIKVEVFDYHSCEEAIEEIKRAKEAYQNSTK